MVYPGWVEERFGSNIPAWAEERWGNVSENDDYDDDYYDDEEFDD